MPQYYNDMKPWETWNWWFGSPTFWRLEHKNHCCGWCQLMSPYAAMTCLAPQSSPCSQRCSGSNMLKKHKSFLASWATTPGVTCSPTLFSYSLGEAKNVTTHVALICWLPKRQRTNWFDTISCFLPGRLHLCIFIILMFATIGVCIYCFTHS